MGIESYWYSILTLLSSIDTQWDIYVTYVHFFPGLSVQFVVQQESRAVHKASLSMIPQSHISSPSIIPLPHTSLLTKKQTAISIIPLVIIKTHH